MILQVALHPEVTIVACVILTLLSCIGIVNFSPKSDTLSLWIPETSVSIRNISSLVASDINKYYPVIGIFPFLAISALRLRKASIWKNFSKQVLRKYILLNGNLPFSSLQTQISDFRKK